jgi:hypothetical protein
LHGPVSPASKEKMKKYRHYTQRMRRIQRSGYERLTIGLPHTKDTPR